MAVIVPNLDFELHLAGRTPGAGARARLEALTPHLALLGGPEDQLLTERPFTPPPELSEALGGLPRVITRIAPGEGPPLRPWGVDDRITALAREHDLPWELPAPATVREVSSKLWSAALEQALGVAVAGARVAHSPGELTRHLATLPEGQRWVLKDPHGVAGQGRILGEGRDLRPQDLRWAQRLLRHTPLLLEPWLPREVDYSVQLEVGAQIQIVAWCRLLVSQGGQFEGIELGRVPEAVKAGLEPTARRVGEALRGAGYFGPAGIDAFTWTSPQGDVELRPLVEVNPRYTFGRVAARLAPLLPPGGIGRWCLLPPQRPPTLPPWRPERGWGALRTSPHAEAGSQPEGWWCVEEPG